MRTRPFGYTLQLFSKYELRRRYSCRNSALVAIMLFSLIKLHNFLRYCTRASFTRTSQSTLNLPKFSSHSCFGSRRETRSCVFTSLYFDLRSNKFEYYLPPGTENMTYVSFDKGRLHYNFSIPTEKNLKGKGYREAGFLFLHAGGRRGKSNRDRKWYEPWKAEIFFESPPDTRKVMSIADTTILWESISPGSFGHLLVDNIIPIFIIARTFDIPAESLQIILMASCEEHFNARTRSNVTSVLWCKHLVESGGLMSPGLSSKEVKGITELIREARQISKEKILFHKVVLGGGGLGMWLHLQKSEYHEKYADPGRRDSRGYGVYFREFQQHLYKQFNIKGNNFNSIPSIVILDKKGSRGGNRNLGQRRISNIDEVLKWIAEEFPGIRVQKINFQPLTWASQLRILSETTILISPFGSVSFRALFLRRGSHVIILGLPVKDISLSNWESDAWLRYQAYLEILNYPIEDSEIVNPANDPKILEDSDIKISRWKICNLVKMALSKHSNGEIFHESTRISTFK